MSISENIAKYRKQKGYTQEKLGEILGVTNQAVSKWESAASLPDVMLLPKIADALEITLNDLYGMTDEPSALKDQNERINEFSIYIQNLIKTHLYKQLFEGTQALNEFAKIEKNTDYTTDIKSAYTIGVIPYTKDGAAFVSNHLSVISSDYNVQNGGRIFDSQEIASGMRKLCDIRVRKVLGYLYSEAFRETPADLNSLADFFKEHDIFQYEFRIKEVSSACGLTEEDTLDAIEKLSSIHIVTVSNNKKNTQYFFEKTRGVETAVTFRVVESMICGEMNWGCGYLVGHGCME